MKIAIGADHGGFALKESIRINLEENGYEVLDKGVYDTDSVDYPDIAVSTCQEVLNGNADKAILICGTGIGISITANKIKGIRCALCAESYSAKLASRHNNANVIALGGRTCGSALAWDIVEAFLTSEFEAGRHERRVHKINNLEDSAC